MYKAELIDVSARNHGVSTTNGQKKWAITFGGTIMCFVEDYFQNSEGIAKGIAASLNTNPRIRLDLTI